MTNSEAVNLVVSLSEDCKAILNLVNNQTEVFNKIVEVIHSEVPEEAKKSSLVLLMADRLSAEFSTRVITGRMFPNLAKATKLIAEMTDGSDGQGLVEAFHEVERVRKLVQEQTNALVNHEFYEVMPEVISILRSKGTPEVLSISEEGEKSLNEIFDLAESYLPKIRDMMGILYQEMDSETPDVDKVVDLAGPMSRELGRGIYDITKNLSGSDKKAAEVALGPDIKAFHALPESLRIRAEKILLIKREVEKKGYEKYGCDPVMGFIAEHDAMDKFLDKAIDTDLVQELVSESTFGDLEEVFKEAIDELNSMEEAKSAVKH